MPIWIMVGLLRVRVLARIGLARPQGRFVYRWVTDAETGKLFCIWLPADAPDVHVGMVEEEPPRQSEDQALH
ncbi:MAG: hypothetical protein J0H14_00670 [Alphaproteobacteria bacterium]|nr:hypothetical protein [Alphaproteobacteria bacterium]